MIKTESLPEWIHVIAVAVVFAILVFVSCSLVNQTNFWSFYVSWTLLVAIILFLGFWAALGPGTTWLRLSILSMAGPLVFVAAIAGLETDPSSPQFIAVSDSDWFSGYLFTFMVTFGVCVACQVPFWAFRIVFGWQLVQANGDWIEKKLSIQDIFFITAIVAVAFALPRYAANMYFDEMINQIQVGSYEFIDTDKLDDAGNPMIFEEVLVTEENIGVLRESRKKQYQSYASSLTIGIVTYSAFISAFALAFVPAVSLSLRMSGFRYGVWYAAVYLFVVYLALAILSVLLSFGGFVRWGQLIPYVIGFGLSFVVAAMFPLLVSHRLGFRLVSNRNFRKRRASSKENASPSESSLVADH